ncbi:MAG: hypothetical protein WD042_09300 [Phycisphaeraceae bacterium]
MVALHEGQCGLCTHFGEHDLEESMRKQIVKKHEAPETLVEECDLPRNHTIHLMVTPVSGCDGFEPARMSA